MKVLPRSSASSSSSNQYHGIQLQQLTRSNGDLLLFVAFVQNRAACCVHGNVNILIYSGAIFRFAPSSPAFTRDCKRRLPRCSSATPRLVSRRAAYAAENHSACHWDTALITAAYEHINTSTHRYQHDRNHYSLVFSTPFISISECTTKHFARVRREIGILVLQLGVSPCINPMYLKYQCFPSCF